MEKQAQRFNERRNSFMNKVLAKANDVDFKNLIDTMHTIINKEECVLLDDLVVTRGKCPNQFNFKSLYNGYGTYLEFTLSFPGRDKEYLDALNALFTGATLSDSAMDAVMRKIAEMLLEKAHDLEREIRTYTRFVDSWGHLCR